MEATKSIDVTLLPHQASFVQNNDKFHALVAGLGSGKTDAGTNFVTRMIVEQPESVPGFIGANGVKQLNRAVLIPLFNTFKRYGIKYEYKEIKQEIIANGRRIMVGTTDKDAIESVLGTEIGWFWVDEAARAPEYAHDLLVGRLRHPEANGLYGRETSTPLGFNWFYDRYVGARKTDEYTYTHATSHANPFLPAGYIEGLQKEYSQKLYEQEVLAKFVHLEGSTVYDCFNEKHIFAFDYRSIPGPIYVGWDFNINPMCIVFVKYHNGRFFLFDELRLEHTNTIKASLAVQKKFPTFRTELEVIPDSTFKNRSVNSTLTSKEILQKDGFKLLHTSNPYIADRQQCLNNLFYNGGNLEDMRILVHPRCKHSIKEFHTLSPAEDEGKKAHLSVAFGYVVWKFAPLKRPPFQPRIIHI